MKTHLDVYKFWLGFCEKLIILFIGAIMIPIFLGQLKLSLLIAFFAISALLGLGVALAVLTRDLWQLESEGEAR